VGRQEQEPAGRSDQDGDEEEGAVAGGRAMMSGDHYQVRAVLLFPGSHWCAVACKTPARLVVAGAPRRLNHRASLLIAGGWLLAGCWLVTAAGAGIGAGPHGGGAARGLQEALAPGPPGPQPAPQQGPGGRGGRLSASGSGRVLLIPTAASTHTACLACAQGLAGLAGTHRHPTTNGGVHGECFYLLMNPDAVAGVRGLA
jgi:hypothetical protein